MTGDAPATAVFLSLSSDIALAQAERWQSRGAQVAGTYRRLTPALRRLETGGAKLVECDLADPASARQAAHELAAVSEGWTVCVVATGLLEPVGSFEDVDFDAWEQSITVNFTASLRVLHALLPHRSRRTDSTPTILFYAGGGTNSAPVRFSAYTVAKIALIKMTELLAAEMPNVRVSIVGPGWVRTKIHDQTLNAGDRAGDAYAHTMERLETGQFTAMEDILDCCDWILACPVEVVSGRNFSVASDPWGTDALAVALDGHPDLFKLRRFGNDTISREGRTS